MNLQNNIFAANLTSLEGEEWKEMRSKISPAFTPNKIKVMLPLMTECALEMIELLRKPAEMNQVVDMKDIITRFAAHIISTCCFGIKGDALKNPKTEVKKMALAFFETNTFRLIRNLIALVAPDLAKKIKMRLIPKQVENFFMNYFRQLVKYRESKKIFIDDVFQTLIELKNIGFKENQNDKKNETPNKKLSFQQLAAEAFAIFSGGIEATSIGTQCALYELSLNQAIQRKVRAEIKQVVTRHEGQITYRSHT